MRPWPTSSNASTSTAHGAGLAVAVDAEVVPRSEWDARPLEAARRVEVLNAIQGG